jgi:hypothetical protein
MNTAYLVIQCGINMLFIGGLVYLIRERRAWSRIASAREERLTALAAELCALGQEQIRQDAWPGAAAPSGASADAAPVRAEAGIARAAMSSAASDRLGAAATLLAQGLPVDRVVAETALPAGEVQVLRNLARAAKSPGAGGRRPRNVAAPARTAATGRRSAGAKERGVVVERHGHA